MGGCRCTFRDCTVSTSRHPGMHFFHYPVFSNMESYERWLKLADKMSFLDLNANAQRNKVICARHFRMECFGNYKMERLIKKKKAVPTLVPLDGKYVLDYEYEEVNGGPELIETPKTVMKHLIPPPNYEYPFKFHDNIDPAEYIKANLITLANTNNSIQLPATTIIRLNETETSIQVPSTTSTNQGVKRSSVLNESCEQPKKKFKILNSAVRRNPSPSERAVKLEISGAETLIDCLNTFDGDNNEQPNENVTSFIWSAMEDSDDNGDNDQNYLDQDLVESHDYSNDALVNVQKCKDQSNDLQAQEENYIKEINELSEHIHELEGGLIKCQMELKLKTNALVKTEQLLKTLKIELKTMENKYEEMDINHNQAIKEINKTSSMEIERLQEENKRLQEKCNKYEKEQQKQKEAETEAVIRSQATSSLIAQKSTISNRQESISAAATNSCNTQNSNSSLSKAQLFIGVKKYVSSSMAALLRMEMFGNADRAWKPDERRVAIDLLQLGEEVYKYVSDEWRLRLPAIREARCWLADAINLLNDEEDL